MASKETNTGSNAVDPNAVDPNAAGSKSEKRIAIYGAGGHARVIADGIATDRVVFIDDDQNLWGKAIDGILVVPPRELPPTCEEFVIGMGDSQLRQKLSDQLERAGLRPLTVVHPSAGISDRASVSSGSVVLAGAQINCGASIARHVIVNTGAIIEHDVRLADFSFVGPRAVLTGRVEVGSHAFVGAGAVVLPGIRIEPGAIVGAGAVVTRDVPAGTIVIGNPAKPLATRLIEGPS